MKINHILIHFFVFITWGVFASSIGYSQTGVPSRQADGIAIKNGVLDLRNWKNFSTDGKISLTGNWNFYPGKRFAELPTRTEEADAFIVPSVWNGKKTGKGISIQARGLACYQLQILLAPSSGVVALSVPGVFSCYNLYANGSLVSSNGTVGMSKATSIPYWDPETIVVEAKNDTLNLVWEVANFHHSSGGISNSIVLGAPGILYAKQNIEISGSLLQAITLIALAILFGLSSFLYRKERYNALLFAALGFVWGVRAFYSNDFLISDLLPGIGWVTNMRIEYLTLNLGVLFGGLFFTNIFEKDSVPLLNRVFTILTLVYCAVIIFTSPLFFTRYLVVYLATAAFVALYASFVMIRAWANKRPGSRYIAVSIIAFAGCGLYNILTQFGVLHYNGAVLNIGYAITGFIMAAGLIKIIQVRIRLIEKEKENLKDNLEQNIERLDSSLQHISTLKSSIEEKENLFREMVENVSDIIYELNDKGQFTFTNAAGEKITGFSKDEILGKFFGEMIHPDYAEQFTSIYIEQIRQQQEFSYLEVPVKTKTGETIWLGQNARLFFKDGWLQKVSVVSRDITKQKQTDEEIRRLSEFQNIILNATAYSIISTSHPESIITSFNEGAELMLGYKAEEVIGKMTPVIFHDAEEVSAKAGLLTEELKMEVRPGIDVFHIKSRLGYAATDTNEWTYIKKDGSRINVELTITTLRNKNNEITGYLGIAKDVTQRKKAELELLKAKEQAEIASNAKSEFLANMSHEIRTPLNGVIGFSDLMMKSNLSDIQQQYMSIISKSANSLLDIINDILDFSKIEAGKLELSVEKADIMEISNQVTDMIKYEADRKGLELLLNISGQVPRFIWTDEIRLRQILVNLLSNAVKFTEAGEIEFKIDVLPVKDETDKTTFRFSVRDTGVGIDPKNQEKIFEVFSQEDASTSKKFGGTGLGLAIANQLLSLMGTHLQLESEPGKGTTFHFDVAFRTNHGNHIEWENTGNIRNILVVDDNISCSLILKNMLALKEITTVHANGGNNAIEKLKAGKKYEVIILDYHMPGMDGIETIRNIKKMFAGKANPPAIILYSSSDDAGITSVCEELNVTRLLKPVKIDQLYNSLSKLKGSKKESPLPPAIAKITDRPVAGDMKMVKVLIAEDNRVNMLLCKTFVQNILPGAIIFEAANGKQAADFFLEKQPDIVLMDIQMPEMTGYEATAEIRKSETGSRVPIIALTAGTVKGEREKCLAAGMDDYISKPFVKDTLEKIIHQWLKP